MGDANINTFWNMSLLVNHALMSSRLRPSWAAPFSTAGTGTSVVVTPPAAPAEGNMLIVLITGIQVRTVTSPGWTQVTIPITTGTNSLFWKIATSSEPANYTFTFSGSMGYTWTYMEFLYSETGASAFSYTDSDTQLSVTTITTGNYTVDAPCLVITGLSLSASHVSSIDNSFTAITTGGTGKLAIRIYSNPVSSPEVTTWTIGGTADASMILAIIKGRVIR